MKIKKGSFSLGGKVVLITGAAQGIGRAIAEKFARNGAIVVVTDIQRLAGEKVVKVICRRGGKAFFIFADLSKENDIKELVNLIIKKFGRLDILVNNARPRLTVLPFEESLNEWDLSMDILLKAPVLLVKYAIPYLRKAKNAGIINISSTNAAYISHQPVTYHLAKAAILQFTRFLAFQFGNQGIRANAVCPGLVDLTDVKKPLTSNNVNRKVVKLAVPLQRAASVEEIANVVLLLCTDTTSYITGQVINVDGGITLGEHFHVVRRAFLHEKE